MGLARFGVFAVVFAIPFLVAADDPAKPQRDPQSNVEPRSRATRSPGISIRSQSKRLPAIVQLSGRNPVGRRSREGRSLPSYVHQPSPKGASNTGIAVSPSAALNPPEAGNHLATDSVGI